MSSRRASTSATPQRRGGLLSSLTRPTSWFRRRTSSDQDQATDQRAWYEDVPPAAESFPNTWRSLSSCLRQLSDDSPRATSDTATEKTSTKALSGAREPNQTKEVQQRLTAVLQACLSHSQQLSVPPCLDDFPSEFLDMVAEQLAAAAQALLQKQDDIFQDQIVQASLAFALSASEESINHDLLAESNLTLHCTSLALALLRRETDDASDAQQSTSELLPSAMLQQLLQFIGNVFDPSQASLHLFCSRNASSVPDMVELSSVEAVLSNAWAVEDWDRVGTTFCLLNAWLRCCGSRAELLLSHRQIRGRLVQALAMPLPSSWHLEVTTAVLASLPPQAANEGSDAWNVSIAFVSGVLGQLKSFGNAVTCVDSAPTGSSSAQQQPIPAESLRFMGNITTAIERAMPAASGPTLVRVLVGCRAFEAFLGILDAARRLTDIDTTPPPSPVPERSVESQISNPKALTLSVGHVLALMLFLSEHLEAVLPENALDRCWDLFGCTTTVDNLSLQLFLNLASGSVTSTTLSHLAPDDTEGTRGALRHEHNASSQWQPHHRVVVRHAVVFRHALDRLYDLASSSQTFLLEYIVHAAAESFSNVTACLEAGLLHSCVDLLEKSNTAPAETLQQLLALVRLLGEFSVPPSLLKRLFNLLYLDGQAFSERLYLPLQATLRGMCRSSGPGHFADLNQQHSMVWVPQLDLSMSSGFSVHMWIRIEHLDAEEFSVAVQSQPMAAAATAGPNTPQPGSVGSISRTPVRSLRTSTANAATVSTPTQQSEQLMPTDSRPQGKGPTQAGRGRSWSVNNESHTGSPTRQTYEPRLFSLFGACGRGVEAFLTAGRLVLKATLKAGATSDTATAVFSAVELPLRRWIAVTITHAPGSRLLGSSSGAATVRIHIDGETVATAPLPLPSIKGPLVDCRFGRGRDQEENTVTNPGRCGTTSLRAQLASVLVAAPLSDSQVRVLAAAGHAFMIGSESSLQTSWDATNPSAAASTLTSRVVAYYPVALCRNGVIHNQAADVVQTSTGEETSSDDAILQGTFCEHRGISHAVGSIGSLQSLLFLLAQLDKAAARLADKFGACSSIVVEDMPEWPRECSKEDVDTGAGGKPDSIRVAAALCVEAFFCLSSDILRDRLHVLQTLQTNSLQMLSALLRQSSCANFSIGALMALQSMLAHDTEQRRLLLPLCREILLDISLWRTSDFAVRIAHIRYIQDTFKSLPSSSAVFAEFNMRHFLDALRDEADQQLRSSVFDPVHHDAERTQLDVDAEQQDALVSAILAVLEILMSRRVRNQEAMCLLQFLATCANDRVLETAMQWMFQLLHSGQGDMAARENLTAALIERESSLLCMYGLLQHRSPSARRHMLAILEFFCNYCQTVDEETKNKLRLLTEGHALNSLLSAHEQCDIETIQGLLQLACGPPVDIVDDSAQDGNDDATNEDNDFAVVRVVGAEPTGSDSADERPLQRGATKAANLLKGCHLLNPGMLAVAFEFIANTGGIGLSNFQCQTLIDVIDGLLYVTDNAAPLMVNSGIPAALGRWALSSLDVEASPLCSPEPLSAPPSPSAEERRNLAGVQYLEREAAAHGLPVQSYACLQILRRLLRTMALHSRQFARGLHHAIDLLTCRQEDDGRLVSKPGQPGPVLLFVLLSELVDDISTQYTDVFPRDPAGGRLLSEIWARSVLELVVNAEEQLYFLKRADKIDRNMTARIKVVMSLMQLGDVLGCTFGHDFGSITKTIGHEHLGIRRCKGHGFLRLSFRLVFELFASEQDEVCRLGVKYAEQLVKSDVLDTEERLACVWELDSLLSTGQDMQVELRQQLIAFITLLLQRNDIPSSAMSSFKDSHGDDCYPPISDLRKVTVDKADGVLVSRWWHHVRDNIVGPLVFAFRDTHYVDHGSLALECSEIADDRKNHSQRYLRELRRHKEASSSKLQTLVLEPFEAICMSEWQRLAGVQASKTAAEVSATRQWLLFARFLVGYRGFLDDGTPREARACQRWRLDRTETFSRMRLRLAPLLDFDPHLEASRLRDNATETSESFERTSSSSSSSVSAALSVPISSAKARSSARLETSTGASSEADMDGDLTEDTFSSWPCRLVSLMQSIAGTFTVSSTHVMFTSSADTTLTHLERSTEANVAEIGSLLDDFGGDFKWLISDIREIHFRRYNLRPTALEIFLVDQTNFFVDFDAGVRQEVHACIARLKPPHLVYGGKVTTPAELLAMSQLTERWRRRLISNFDYLMMLNTIAGRTYNDLNQYPVFPWVLADYTSETLDLEDPRTFRDLSKPVGALNAVRAEQVRTMFEEFDDPTGMVKPFHYGTHYSNAAGVVHFLIRLEPFTSLHIALQSGRFDHADRQFHSIPVTWQGIMEGVGDVKELTPEFFYLAEFLKNHCEFDLGRLQSGERVNDVRLPPWAPTPYDFVRLHRKALESEYVSTRLHHWIDLIFGYKQRGKPAEEALNVFYYTSYEGAVDLDAVDDPAVRAAQEGMIREFGQTPSQLLTSPHPARMSVEEAAKTNLGNANALVALRSVFSDADSLRAYFVTPSYRQRAGAADWVAYIHPPASTSFKSWITRGLMQQIVTVTSHGTAVTHEWLPHVALGTSGTPFALDLMAPPRKEAGIGTSLLPGRCIGPETVAVTRSGDVAFVGLAWDATLKVISTKTSRVLQSMRGPFAPVTSVALDSAEKYVVTGCQDGSCMLWRVAVRGQASLGRRQSRTASSPSKSQSGARTSTSLSSSSSVDPSTSTSNPQAAADAAMASGVTATDDVLLGPFAMLLGHEAEVSCVCVSSELDLIVSGSLDGTCNLYGIRHARYIRTITPSAPGVSDSLKPRSNIKGEVKHLCLSNMGHIVVHCAWARGEKRANTLGVYTCNGALLATDAAAGHVVDMRLSGDNENLVTATKSGAVSLRSIHNLRCIRTINVHAPVRCMALTESDAHILLGLRDGKILVLTVPHKHKTTDSEA